MGLLFCDGFDHYDTAHLFEKWDGSTQGGGHDIEAFGRNSGTTYNNCLVLTTDLTKNLPNSAMLTVGAALNPNLLDGNQYRLFEFRDGTQEQVTMWLTGSAQLQIIDGNGNVLGTTSAPALVSNTYTYVECQVTFGTSSNGAVSLQINGASVLSLSGITTSLSGNAYANALRIHGVSNNAYYDDLYVCDGTGTYNNTFLGDVRIALALPNADGRVNQWTATGGSGGNYTCVNEVPPDDDTSYVSSDTVGQIDAYEISSIGSPSAIVAVQLVASAKKDDSASRVIGLGFGNSSTDDFDAGHSVTNSYVMYMRQMDSNPITSAAWATGDLTSAQIALKVIS